MYLGRIIHISSTSLKSGHAMVFGPVKEWKSLFKSRIQAGKGS